MRRFLQTCALALVAVAPATAFAGNREDRAAAEQIATIVRDSGEVQNYSLGVKYKGGTVWLSGQVANKKQMQSVLAVVSDIEGVKQIVNGMSVGSGAGLKQPGAGGKARRVSATSVDVNGAAPAGPEGNATPAGFHHLAARNGAGHPMPCYNPGTGPGNPPAYDQPHMPGYAWPSYASYPNYAAVTYPKQYSPTAFPFIGPFYPYPQVPLGWRKVALEWDDGWWFLDFYDRGHH